MHHSPHQNETLPDYAAQTKPIAQEDVVLLLKNTEAMDAFVVAIRDFMCLSFGFKDPGYLQYLEAQLLDVVSGLLKKSFNDPELSDDFFKQRAKQFIKPFLQPKQNSEFIRRFLEKIPEWLRNNDQAISLVMDKSTYVISTFIRRVAGRTQDALMSYSRQCLNKKPKIYVDTKAMHRVALSVQVNAIKDLLGQPDSSMSAFTKKHYIQVNDPNFYFKRLQAKGFLNFFVLFPLVLLLSFIVLSKIQLEEYQILPAIIGCFTLAILAAFFGRRFEVAFNKTFYFHDDVFKCCLNGIILNHLEANVAENPAADNENLLPVVRTKRLPRHSVDNTLRHTDTSQPKADILEANHTLNTGNKNVLAVDLANSTEIVCMPKRNKRKHMQTEYEYLISKHKKNNEASMQKLLKIEEKTLHFSLLHGNDQIACRYEPFTLCTPMTEPYVVSELWSDAPGRKSLNHTHLMIWNRSELDRAFKKIDKKNSTGLKEEFLKAHECAHIVNAQGQSGFVPCQEYDEEINGNPVSFKLKLCKDFFRADLFRVPYTEQKEAAITWGNGAEQNTRKIHYATGVNKVH